MKPFQELVEFIADAAGPERLASFRPSKAAQLRVESLLEKQRDGVLRKAEREELEMFLWLEHTMRLAKARAEARPSVAGVA